MKSQAFACKIIEMQCRSSTYIRRVQSDRQIWQRRSVDQLQCGNVAEMAETTILVFCEGYGKHKPHIIQRIINIRY
jgi:hypothetical protein